MPFKCRTRLTDQNFKYSQYPKISTSKFETIESEAGFPQALGLIGPGKLA